MTDQKKVVAAVKELLERAQIEPNARYLTARQVQLIYNIPAKTLLNRSNLKSTHKRYLPSLRLRGGRKKFFEKKVIERLFVIDGGDQSKNGGLK